MVYKSYEGRKFGRNENFLLVDGRPVGALPQAFGRGKTFYVDSNVAASDGTSPDTALATIATSGSGLSAKGHIVAAT